MTRTEFVRSYARRSGFSDEWADMGIVDTAGGRTMIALPCACGYEACEGWAMLSGSTVLDHLELYAPEKLRRAYREAVGQ
jgi:hypothetical protein